MPEPGQIGGKHLDAIIPVYGVAGYLAARWFKLTLTEAVLIFAAWEVIENKLIRDALPWSRPDTFRDSTLEVIAAGIGAILGKSKEDANADEYERGAADRA